MPHSILILIFKHLCQLAVALHFMQTLLCQIRNNGNRNCHVQRAREHCVVVQRHQLESQTSGAGLGSRRSLLVTFLINSAIVFWHLFFSFNSCLPSRSHILKLQSVTIHLPRPPTTHTTLNGSAPYPRRSHQHEPPLWFLRGPGPFLHRLSSNPLEQ